MVETMKFDFIKALGMIHLKNLTEINLSQKNENRFFCVDTYTALKNFISKSLDKQSFEKDECIAFAHMVYGWMPTILNDANDEIGTWANDDWVKIKGCLEKARSGENFGVDELKNVMVLTNNSIVGTSKLLHFINPNVYPIYDSRVFHAIRKLAGDKKKTEDSNTVNDENKYLAYVGWVHRVINEDKEGQSLIEMKTQLKEKGFVKDEASNVRVVEVLLYINGKEE
jgi:hypothetical protein